MSSASTTRPAAKAPRTFFGHPMGLATLFTTELWERFSFYGMRALLVLYLTAAVDGTYPPGGGLGMSNANAIAIYGSYLSLVYLLPLAGGWIADRIVGAHRAVLIGGIIIAVGHFMMATSWSLMFWLGLLAIAVGTGLLKPNISKMVGDLYVDQADARRDAGFSLFYMGINLGAFIAPLITGALATNVGWHIAFITAGIGMTVALVVYVAGARTLKGIGRKPANPAPASLIVKMALGVTAGVAVLVIALWIQGLIWGFEIADVSVALTIAVVLIAVVYFWRLFANPSVTPIERKKLRGFLWLFLGSMMFWMVYDQAGSTLTIFAEKWTNLTFGGWTMPTSWLQSINPLFIIAFAPLFSVLWVKLGNRAPSTPLKFAIAIIGIGLSFIIMVPPALAANGGEKSALVWIIGVYLIQTWAELLLSPTGLSASTQLAPNGMVSQVLALWFLATSVGDAIGGQAAGLLSNADEQVIFIVMGGAAILAGIGFLLCVKPISRLMSGVH